MATHSSILAWRTPRTEETMGYGPQSHKESNMTKANQHAGRHSTVQRDHKSYIHLLIGTEVFLFCFVWLVSLFFYLSVCVQSQLQHTSLCCGAWALQLCPAGSSVALLGRSFSAACETLVSRLGIEPVPPALRGRCLTTEPPRKSLVDSLSVLTQHTTPSTWYSTEHTQFPLFQKWMNE